MTTLLQVGEVFECEPHTSSLPTVIFEQRRKLKTPKLILDGLLEPLVYRREKDEVQQVGRSRNDLHDKALIPTRSPLSNSESPEQEIPVSHN